ncbi:MAG: hypothetical protein II840_11385, partial [Kiritimatiellae bacterium]|nr:hypothetical protein [Kiritimatiellia bacterium]
MKTVRNFTLCILHFTLAFATANAKTFDVDISTGRPAASNEAYYHGETIEFRAVRGRSVVTNVEYSCVYYQTNGMDSVWWHTDGLVFHPTNDVGAASYRFFLEGRDDLGRDWHANGLLRLLPSPGFTPNTIELPVARLDFAVVDVANAPYYDKTETEAKIVELAPAETDPVWDSEKSDYATVWDLDDYATVWDIGDLDDRATALEAATNDLTMAIGGALDEAKSYADGRAGEVWDSLTPLTFNIYSAIGSAATDSTNHTDGVAASIRTEVGSVSNDVSTLSDTVATLSAEIAPAVTAYPRVHAFMTGSTNANIVVTNFPMTAEEDAGRVHFDPSDPDLDFSTVPASLRIEDASSG